MPNHEGPRGAGWTGPGEEERDMYVQIIDQIARLRDESDDLRGRVRRLESHSGRGIIHPCDFSYGLGPRPS